MGIIENKMAKNVVNNIFLLIKAAIKSKLSEAPRSGA